VHLKTFHALEKQKLSKTQHLKVVTFKNHFEGTTLRNLNRHVSVINSGGSSGVAGWAVPTQNQMTFFFFFKFINYLIDDLLLESKYFYRYVKTFPRRIFLRVDMSFLRDVR
jgi:hypothetical protein